MKVYATQGANIVVGGRRLVFAPFNLVDVNQDTADYLLSTGRFFQEGETPPDISDSTKILPIRIGVHRIGGVGDALLGSCVITAISRRFPNSRITAHTHSTIQKIWAGHPCIHHIDSGYRARMNNSPMASPNYDVFFDLMPDCCITYNPRTMPPETVMIAKKAREELDKYKRIPGCRNHLKPFCHVKGFEALDVFNFAFGTDATLKDMYIPQNTAEKGYYTRAVLEKKLPAEYITVHDWAFNGRQTKSWFPNYWKELLCLLKKEYGFPSIQIGGAGEESLHADYDLRGRTTFGESASILQHSFLHVDNESTPAHLCAAVGTPCAVLCGPTMKYWRHRENLNIVSDYHCQECEGAPNWYKVCEDKGSFGCMKAITPEYAFEKIKTFMREKVHATHSN